MSNISNNLEAYWAFNDFSTQGQKKISEDASGNHRHAELQGKPGFVADDKFGQVLQFDGVNDYLVLPKESTASTTAITISFWAKGDASLDASSQTQLFYAENAQRVISIRYPWNSKILFKADDGATANNVEANVALADYQGKWVHWACTKDTATGKMQIYRDGVLLKEVTGKNVAIGTDTQVILGAKKVGANAATSFFKGQLAHVRMFSKALTASEVAEVMRTDETAEESFRLTHPLAFSLLNAHQHGVLTLNNQAQSLHLTIRNTHTQTIEWEAESVTASASKHHLHLQLRPGTLANNPATIATKDTTNWSVAHTKASNGMVNIYLLRKTALSLTVQQEIQISLDGFLADNTQGTRGTQLYWAYQKMHYSGEQNNTLQGHRQGHLLLSHAGINQGVKHPFELLIANANQVINDGTTANNDYQLKIRLNEQVTFKKGSNAGDAQASKLIFSFPEENHPWALANSSQISNINITTNESDWRVVKNAQSSRTEWTAFYEGSTDLVKAKGEVLSFTIGGIITAKATGTTYLKIRYENLVDFGDTTLQTPLEKSPLVFGGDANQTRVGIGTNSPSKKLHVEGDTYLNGKVGIGINSPQSKLHIYNPGAATKVVIGKSFSAGGFSTLVLGTKGDKNSAGFIQAIKVAGKDYGSLILNEDGGNVGIGTTTPSAKLDVNGNFHTSGNVGIGTSAPRATLDVNGSIHINGTVALKGDKPIRYLRYSIDADNPDRRTKFRSTEWFVGIVGFKANSSGNLNSLMVEAYVHSDGFWHLRLDLIGVSDRNWVVNVLAIRQELVQGEGLAPL